MFKSFLSFCLLSMLLLSCAAGENYEKACGFERDGKTFIKLKGKRLLAVHDPVSVISNKTYGDSMVIQVPSLQNGIIKGKDIPTRQGYYKYTGEVIVKDEKLFISLNYDKTDKKKTAPLSWNGQYILIRN